MYTAAQQVTQGLDGPLKAELTSIDKDMSKIADSLIKTVQKDMGTKAAAAASGSSTAAASSSSAASGGSAATSAAGLGKISSDAGSAASGLSSVASAASGAASGLGSVASAAGAAASALGSIAGAAGGGKSGGGSGGGSAGGGGGAAATTGGGGGGPNETIPVRQLPPQYPNQPVEIHHHRTEVHVHVAGSVSTQQDLQNALQTGFLEQADRNLQTGLQLRGRGA